MSTCPVMVVHPGPAGRAAADAVPVPAGVVTAAVSYAGYALTRQLQPGGGVPAARTAALLAVLVTALWTVLVLARPLTAGRVAPVAAMAGVVVAVLALPLLRDGVLLLVLSSTPLLLGTGLGAVGALLVEAVSRMPGTRLPRVETVRGVAERTGDRR